MDGSVYALDLATGQEKWRFKTDGPVISSPLVTAKTLYVGSNDGNVYALDITTGQEIWRFATQGEVSSSPMLMNDTIYVGSSDQTLYALDAPTGALRWQFATKGAIGFAAAGVGGTVYVGSFDGTLYAVDGESGQLLWQFETQGGVLSGPAVAGESVFFGSLDGNVYAVNRRTGQGLWEFATGDQVGSSRPMSTASSTWAATVAASMPVHWTRPRAGEVVLRHRRQRHLIAHRLQSSRLFRQFRRQRLRAEIAVSRPAVSHCSIVHCHFQVQPYAHIKPDRLLQQRPNPLDSLFVNKFLLTLAVLVGIWLCADWCAWWSITG